MWIVSVIITGYLSIVTYKLLCVLLLSLYLTVTFLVLQSSNSNFPKQNIMVKLDLFSYISVKTNFVSRFWAGILQTSTSTLHNISFSAANLFAGYSELKDTPNGFRHLKDSPDYPVLFKPDHKIKQVYCHAGDLC